MESRDLRKRLGELKAIFAAGVAAVDPYRLIRERLAAAGGFLTVLAEEEERRFDLSGFSRLLVLGAGKAAARMALGVEEVLGGRLARGLIAVKPGHGAALGKVRVIEAGHPLPDRNSVRAAEQVLDLCRGAGEGTLFLNLISGGASALLCLPRPPLSLEDKQETTRLLLGCGATIQEINCLRKHLSLIKGGRLAERMAPGTSLNLILSDVAGDRLDTIASGLTVPDPTTYEEARAVVLKYGLRERLPAGVAQLLEQGARGLIPETPKPGDPVFSRVNNFLLGTNRTALLAARVRAEALGYHTVLLTSQLIGEAREAAGFLLGIGRDIRRHGLLVHRPACVIAGGETTVTLRGGGKGGRNQELALSFLAELGEDPGGSAGLYLLSASSDGGDGPTDAAGAFACPEFLRRAGARGLSAREYLARNDSYAFFARIEGLLKTGPTNTNVCDLQILLVT